VLTRYPAYAPKTRPRSDAGAHDAPTHTDGIMRRRVFSLVGVLRLAALALLLVSPAFAQPASRISISTNADEIGSLLQQGRQLEMNERWGEALSHYEEAIRQFPHDVSLHRRFDFARLHFDLGRRYADGSFCEMVESLPIVDSLELYSQVLAKIESHYVEVTNWKELIERGTNSFEVALNEPAFLARNLPEQDRAAIDRFRGELRRVLGPKVIATRGDARQAVSTAAVLARQRLGICPAAVVLEYLCGATNALDVYSAYLTPNQLDEVYSQIEGNFVGLGIELKAHDSELLIVCVIPGSPAELAGMLAGDRILSVDGQPTAELSTDEAANLLQGRAGSIVRLGVITPNRQPRTLVIQRRRVDVPSIDDAEIIDRDYGVGYLRLVCFQKTTCRDMEAALWKLHREGMKRLIIDLRGNPGGLLVTAVEVADKFLSRGTIVSTRGRDSREDFTYPAHVSGTWRVPLVVLIDHDSASAAEIFAGAIRDHRRGTIVGERSYGKGSVQGIFPLDVSAAGLRLTTAKFYSPTGRAYSRVGVEPDVLVHTSSKPAGDTVTISASAEDAVLSAALQTARTLGQPQQVRNLR